jgi:ketosteroid isomerase-like protein
MGNLADAAADAASLRLFHAPLAARRTEMTMTTEQNIEFVKDLYAAFSRGDLPYILERFAPELEVFGVNAGGNVRAPWHAPIAKTREGVGRYFELLLGALEPVSLDPRHFAAAGDYVYATIDQVHKVRKTGKQLVMKDGVHRFKLRGGQIVGWFAAEDTQLSVEALG